MITKGRLFHAIDALDVPEVARCLDAKPTLLRACRRGVGLARSALAVCTRGDDPRAARQVDLLQLLFARGVDSRETTPDVDGPLPLTWFAAARSRHPGVVGAVLDAGAAPAGLFAAGWHGDADVVALLVERGAALEAVVRDETPFLHCFKNRRHAGAQALVAAGADIDVQDSRGRTACHFALRRAPLLDRLQWLVDLGADLDLPDAEGQTARTLAARKRDPAVRAVVLGSG